MLISRAKRPLRAGVFTHQQADFASKRHIPQLNYYFDLINKIYCSVRSFTLPALTTGALHPVRVLAASFNLLTTQQPWAAERLARHAGKTIRISLKGFAVTLTIDAQGHLEQSDEAVVPDVILDVDPEKIRIAQLFDPNARQDVAELVHISGQAALAQVVSDLARDLRPDPEDALARWFGDVPAKRMIQGAKGLLTSLLGASQSLAQNTAEYLTEETDALLGRPAMTSLTTRQAQVLERLEALANKQALLSARLERLLLKKGQRA